MGVIDWGLGIVMVQASDSGNLFSIVVHETSDLVGPDIIDRTGRGQDRAGGFRSGNLRGEGKASGKMISDTMPLVTNIMDFVGTMTYSLNTATTPPETISVNVIIRNVKMTREHKTQNSVDVTFDFKHIGNYTLPNGSESATPPTLSSQQTDAGLSKVIDHYGYEDSATQRFDLPSVTDTDIAEQIITSAIFNSAVNYPALSALKPDLVRFTKGDRAGGIASVTFRRTNSQDRRVLPQTTTDTDPLDIRTRQQIPVTYTVGQSPVAPSTPSGLTPITHHDLYFNSTHAMRVYFFGKNSSVDDLNNPHFRDHTDVSDLSTTHTESAVFDQGSPPSAPAAPPGLYLSFIDDIRVTVAGTPHWVRVWLYEKMTAKMKLEIGNSDYFIDPNGLTSHARNAKLDATPVLTSGFVDRGTLFNNITSAHTLEVTQGGLRSTADDITYPGTETDTDPIGLQSRGRQTLVLTSAAAAALTLTSAVTAVPSGQKPRLISVSKINRKKNRVTQQSGVRSTQDDFVMPRTRSTRSALKPYTDAVAQIVTCSAADTAVSLANLQWNAFLNFPFAYDLSAEKIQDNKAAIVYRYLNPGILYISNTTAFTRYAYAYMDFADSNKIKVFVQNSRQIATSLYLLTLRPIVTTQIVQRISVVRSISSLTNPPLKFSQFWNTNSNSPFTLANISYSIGTLLFTGSRVKTNLTLAGSNLTYAVVYDSVYDSLGAFRLNGWNYQVLTSANISAGAVDITTITGGGITATLPTQSDFSFMTA